MFRISLRELFMLILIVALAMGWYLDFRQTRRAMADERYSFQLKVENLNGKLRLAQFRFEQAEKTARMKRYLPILATHPPGSAYWVSDERSPNKKSSP